MAVRFLHHFGLLSADDAQNASSSGEVAVRQIAEPLLRHTPNDDPRLLALGAVASAFSTLPYENLTRIIRYHEQRLSPFRTPEIVVSDHIADHSGGTCFSLTSTLLHIVRWLGFEAEPLLADRRYGANTHSALLVRIDGEPHLLDPGFLINRPVPLTAITAADGIELPTDFNRVVLRREGEHALQLLTRNNQQGETYRLTFKTRPADSAEFINAWKSSFETAILHKPVLTKVADGRQWFLNARRLQVRELGNSSKRQLSDEELLAEIVARFGIRRGIVQQALTILRRQGDLPGTPDQRAAHFVRSARQADATERSHG